MSYQPRAITSDEQDILDLQNQFSRIYLAIHPATVVYSARVNGTPSPIDQNAAITFDGGSGTLSDVKPGMTLWVGTTAGAYDVGMARIRKVSDPSHFFIGEESELSILDDQYLSVIDEFGIWAKHLKLINIDTALAYADDDVIYSDQHENMAPVPVMGPPVVLWLLDSALPVTAPFDASDSWEPGGHSLAFSWAAPGASSTSGMSTSTPIIKYNAPGVYRVSCTVTTETFSPSASASASASSSPSGSKSPSASLSPSASKSPSKSPSSSASPSASTSASASKSASPSGSKSPSASASASASKSASISQSRSASPSGSSSASVSASASASKSASASASVSQSPSGSKSPSASPSVAAGAGDTTTGYRYVYVYDDANPPLSQFTPTQMPLGTTEDGWSFAVQCWSEADRASVRDRAPVIMFARDFYGDREGSYGYIPGRENILAVGYIEGETIHWEPDQSYVTFQVKGPRTWIGRTQAFVGGYEDTTSAPADWFHFQNANIRKVIWDLLRWRSTISEVIDCYVEDNNWRSREFSSPATGLWEQMISYAQLSVMAMPSCDRFGRLFVQIDSQISLDRSAFPVVMDLDPKDWIPPIEFTRRPYQQVSQVNLSGVSFDGTDPAPLFALSPGHVFGRQGSVYPKENLLLPDQATALSLAGLLYGHENNDYPLIPINLSSNNRFFDIAPPMYTRLSMAAGDNPRGISFTDKRLIPRRITYAWDAASGALLPQIQFEGETFAEIAVKGDPPTEEGNCPDGFTWDPESGTCLPPPSEPDNSCPPGQHFDADLGECVDDGITAGDSNTLYVVGINFAARTRIFLTTPPTFELITGAITGDIRDFILEPYNPANEAWCMSSDGLWKTDDLNSSPPTWDLVLAYGDMIAMNGSYTAVVSSDRTAMRVQRTIADAGYIGIHFQANFGVGGHQPRMVYAHSHDGGDSWSAYTHNWDVGNLHGCSLNISNHDATTIYSTLDDAVWKSTDGGHSFLGGPSGLVVLGQPANTLEVPVDGNVTDQIVLAGGNRGAPNLLRSIDGGNNWSDISPTYAGQKHGCGQAQNVIQAYSSGGSLIYGIFCDGSGGTNNAIAPHRIFRSDDSGASWSYIADMPVLSNGFYFNLGQWPYNPDWLYVMFEGYTTDDDILFSQDGGVTWTSKIGNLASVTGILASDLFDNLRGWHLIVPVWVPV